MVRSQLAGAASHVIDLGEPRKTSSDRVLLQVLSLDRANFLLPRKVPSELTPYHGLCISYGAFQLHPSGEIRTRAGT